MTKSAKIGKMDRPPDSLDVYGSAQREYSPSPSRL